MTGWDGTEFGLFAGKNALDETVRDGVEIVKFRFFDGMGWEGKVGNGFLTGRYGIF